MSQSPPAGHATWTAVLLAETLGDVSVHYVWRVLRQHGIHLQAQQDDVLTGAKYLCLYHPDQIPDALWPVRGVAAHGPAGSAALGR